MDENAVMKEELDEIERLDREATPGPWGEFLGHAGDARFVARARTLLPKLARAYRALQGAQEQSVDEAYRAGRREAIEEAVRHLRQHACSRAADWIRENELSKIEAPHAS